MKEANKNDKIYMGNLLEMYEHFLTDKQLAYMQLYYQEDYSLQEIAEIYKVTRVAIHNQISHAQKKLLDFEDKLHVYYVYSEVLPLVEKGYHEENWEDIATSVEKIKEI